MRHIPLLPLAPRPFEDELISSWQRRVASRYGLRVADIDAWLELDDEASEARDFQPDPANLWRWARACRIRPNIVEALAFCHHSAPLGYTAQSRMRGVCCACLEDDRRNGRDQYLRRGWSRVETVACLIHRVRLHNCFCPRCFTCSDFKFEYRDGRVELICPGCLAAMSRLPSGRSELRHTDLLIETMGAIDNAEKGRGKVELAEVGKAINLLWSASPNSGKPEISLFGVEVPFGRASVPMNREAPMTCLSLAWRSTTLLTIAQMLDLGSVRSDFGPPSECLTFAFQQLGSSVASDQRPAGRAEAKIQGKVLRLRTDSDYLRLAAATTGDPHWQKISKLKGRSRSKALSRLARDLLESVSEGSGTTL